MGGDLVEQHDRRDAADIAGDEPGMGEDQADEQRLLLAGRGARRRRCPSARGGPRDRSACGPVERAPGGAVARRGSSRSRIAVVRPRRRAPACGEQAFRLARRARGRPTGKGEARRARRRSGRRGRSTVSARAAATATPSAAISRSTASSQARVRRSSSSRRLRERSARSNAPTRAPWPGSIASTSRSRKRRRSPAGPGNSPSRAGVSQTRRRWSAKAAAEPTGSPSMRHRGRRPRRRRRIDAGAETRGPPALRRASIETAKPPSPPCRAMSASSARRRPRPGREQRERLEQIGLAGAVLAGERDERRPDVEIERRVGAEILQDEARDPGRRASRGRTRWPGSGTSRGGKPPHRARAAPSRPLGGPPPHTRIGIST